MEALDDAGRERVDEQLATWRQGDCVIGEHWFLFRTDTERPLTRDAVAAVAEGAEKAVVPAWARVDGCRTDDDSRRFSLALARKRARTAFPDDFVAFARPLMARMSLKHDKQTDEGRALRSLREIRVGTPTPWN